LPLHDGASPLILAKLSLSFFNKGGLPSTNSQTLWPVSSLLTRGYNSAVRALYTLPQKTVLSLFVRKLLTFDVAFTAQYIHTSYEDA